MEEPAAADCWEKIKGVWLFIKVVNLHHLAFPNGGCRQAMTLTKMIHWCGAVLHFHSIQRKSATCTSCRAHPQQLCDLVGPSTSCHAGIMSAFPSRKKQKWLLHYSISRIGFGEGIWPSPSRSPLGVLWEYGVSGPLIHAVYARWLDELGPHRFRATRAALCHQFCS